MLLITHDLGVVAQYVDRVLVMYAGRVVEKAAVVDLFESPRHPYTEGLLNSIPSVEADADRLKAIPGMVPSALAMPPGCRFAPCCPYARSECDAADPPLLDAGSDRSVACIRLTDYRPVAQGEAR